MPRAKRSQGGLATFPFALTPPPRLPRVLEFQPSWRFERITVVTGRRRCHARSGSCRCHGVRDLANPGRWRVRLRAQPMRNLLVRVADKALDKARSHADWIARQLSHRAGRLEARHLEGPMRARLAREQRLLTTQDDLRAGTAAWGQ